MDKLLKFKSIYQNAHHLYIKKLSAPFGCAQLQIFMINYPLRFSSDFSSDNVEGATCFEPLNLLVVVGVIYAE